LLSKVAEGAAEAAAIKDSSIVAISGFNLATAPEHLILQLFDSYTKTGHPCNLFIISDALPAMPGRALDFVAEKLYADPNQNFMRGMLMPFLGFSPWLQKMVTDNRIESYGWPLGIAAYWFREVASGRPGLITKIGLETFLDPRQDGAALNDKASKSISREGPANLSGHHAQSCRVSLINIEGEEFLLYRAPKPDYALIRASVADENGNLSMRDEGIRGTTLSIAQAAKARPNSGRVIAQVRWLTQAGSIDPWDVDVPGPIVDSVVVSPKQHHWQGGSIEYDPRISYSVLPPITDALVRDISSGGTPPADYEKVIARRVLLELVKVLEDKGKPVLVNLGIGIPAFVSAVAAEEHVTEFIITVLESGPWGGLALSGPDFGLAMSPFALSTIPDMFSNFEGGIIDAASLGFLQIDRFGNVNPSMLPNRAFGPGGFPVIAGGAPKTYFAGAFTGGQSKITVAAGKELRIEQDGNIRKFVESVYKIVFSGHQAVKFGKEILYVTERAVFGLGRDGISLLEFAPGIDVDKDILQKMDFAPVRDSRAIEMDKRLFKQEKTNIREEVLRTIRA
jgi:acyl CoA:acetate/3-ketoacid CoA transferase